VHSAMVNSTSFHTISSHFRPCNDGIVTYTDSDPMGYCAKGCAKIPLCDSVIIPFEHLKVK